MKQELITALAREYAEGMCSHMEDDFIKDEAIRDKEEAFRLAVEHLSRRYCLVEKSKATALCRLALEHGDSVDYGLIDGLTDIVCELFPEQYQQVADNPDLGKEVE